MYEIISEKRRYWFEGEWGEIYGMVWGKKGERINIVIKLELKIYGLYILWDVIMFFLLLSLLFKYGIWCRLGY